MKSKRAREAAAVEDVKAGAVAVAGEEPPMKKRKSSGDGEVTKLDKKYKKDKSDQKAKKDTKDKKDKKEGKESRKERKDKRKDLQNLPGDDDGDVQGEENGEPMDVDGGNAAEVKAVEEAAADKTSSSKKKKDKKARKSDVIDAVEMNGAGAENGTPDNATPKSKKSKKDGKKDDEKESKKVKKEAKHTPAEANGQNGASEESASEKKKSKKEGKAKKEKAKTNGEETQTPTKTGGTENGTSEKKSKKDKDKDKTAADDQVPSEKADRHIVFVGNLPYTATAETISAHFTALNPASVRCLTRRHDEVGKSKSKSKDKSTTSKDKNKDKEKEKGSKAQEEDAEGPCRGIAFIEFADVRAQRACLDRFHHSLFDDGKSPARKINVELTAGGGGKTQHRKDKIRVKNEKLDGNRAKRIEREKKDAAAAKDGAGTAAAANSPAMGDSIHPSRLARNPGLGH